jgi:hypothetical protein
MIDRRIGCPIDFPPLAGSSPVALFVRFPNLNAGRPGVPVFYCGYLVPGVGANCPHVIKSIFIGWVRLQYFFLKRLVRDNFSLMQFL